MRIPSRYLGICGCVILSAALHLHFVAVSNATDEAKGKRRFAWRKTPASLALLNGETVVWQFNHLQDGKEKGCPYFHPLGTMEGAVLTDLRPGDHLWHRGLRFAWKKINRLEGYWTWPEGRERWPDKILGHTDVTAVKVTANHDFSARFELEISYHPPGKPPDLTEKRGIAVSAPDRNGNYHIDWHGVFTAGARGVVLDRTPILGEEEGKWFGGYAGLQFRVAHHDRFAAWTLTNSEGVSVTSKADAISVETRKRLEPLHGKPSRWMDLTFDMAGGKRAGVTIMDHPGNLRHPPPWHVAAMPHEFHHAPLFNAPFTLEAGKVLPFRFRIVIHAGLFQRPEAEWAMKPDLMRPAMFSQARENARRTTTRSICLQTAQAEEDRAIEIWYGPRQSFGQIGEAQPWVNILGRVRGAKQLEALRVTVNDGPAQALSMGGDLHRLANAGDFNAEFPWDAFHAGENLVRFDAEWRDGAACSSNAVLQIERGRKWPLPYAVDFSTVKNLQAVVQIVDGRWALTQGGVRTVEPYYDRVLCLGDTSWTDFEATVRLTLHGFTPLAPGPPTYNVTHMGVALRWRGHTADGRQPNRRWYPLGAQGELLIKPDLSTCQWRILPNEKQRIYAERRNAVAPNQQFRIKAQVATLGGGRSRYRFKQWMEGDPEPPGWDVQAFEQGVDDFPSGSLCLVPHNTDITIHEIRVKPLGELPAHQPVVRPPRRGASCCSGGRRPVSERTPFEAEMIHHASVK